MNSFFTLSLALIDQAADSKLTSSKSLSSGGGHFGRGGGDSDLAPDSVVTSTKPLSGAAADVEVLPPPPLGDPVETETPLMVTEVGAPISSGALGGATWGGAGAVSLGAPPPRGATVASRVTFAPSPLLTDIDGVSELGAAPVLLFSLGGGNGAGAALPKLLVVGGLTGVAMGLILAVGFTEAAATG